MLKYRQQKSRVWHCVLSELFAPVGFSGVRSVTVGFSRFLRGSQGFAVVFWGLQGFSEVPKGSVMLLGLPVGFLGFVRF